MLMEEAIWANSIRRGVQSDRYGRSDMKLIDRDRVLLANQKQKSRVSLRHPHTAKVAPPTPYARTLPDQQPRRARCSCDLLPRSLNLFLLISLFL
jgi:hypothetical protein